MKIKNTMIDALEALDTKIAQHTLSDQLAFWSLILLEQSHNPDAVELLNTWLDNADTDS